MSLIPNTVVYSMSLQFLWRDAILPHRVHRTRTEETALDFSREFLPHVYTSYSQQQTPTFILPVAMQYTHPACFR
jgi:hypothetical protein